MDEKQFPIMLDYSKRTYIPWDVISPHEMQARHNHGQSLQRLAERGGLSWCEAVAILKNRQWEKMNSTEAESQVMDIVNNFVRG